MTINEKYGKIIRQLREKNGVSQEKFANMIGMDRSYYATIEAGKHNVTLSKIEDIANGLGVSISKIMNMIESLDDLR